MTSETERLEQEIAEIRDFYQARIYALERIVHGLLETQKVHPPYLEQWRNGVNNWPDGKDDIRRGADAIITSVARLEK